MCIVNGLDTLEAGSMFPVLGESRTRGHSLRIRSKPFSTETRKHFFSQRVVSLWDSLPQRAVEAGSQDAFKRELDRALKDSGVRGYGEAFTAVGSRPMTFAVAALPTPSGLHTMNCRSALTA